MAEKQFLTKKGYEERVALLENLKVVRRKEVAQKLKEAREQGDLSENAEYDAAKDEQRDIETQITELEAILSNAEIIQDNDKSTDRVKMESVLHRSKFLLSSRTEVTPFCPSFVTSKILRAINLFNARFTVRSLQFPHSEIKPAESL